MSSTVTRLHAGTARQAYRRLAPLADKCRIDNEKFIQGFYAEWAELPRGERAEFAKLWGWTYDYCRKLAHAGRVWVDKKTALQRGNIVPLLPTSLGGMIAIAESPTKALTTMAKAGLFRTKTPSAPEIKRAVRQGVVPGLKKLKPRDDLEKLKMALAAASNGMGQAVAELTRARDLMSANNLDSARGPEVRRLNSQFKRLCKAMGDVQGVDFELLEG